MTLRLIGAACILLCCAGFGFSVAAEHKREEKCLRELMKAVQFMICELEYRLPPLPGLIQGAAQQSSGIIQTYLQALSQRLMTQEDADATICAEEILKTVHPIPLRTKLILQQFGVGLGRFAMSGQVSCLKGIELLCQRDLRSLETDREQKLRSYRTLGICAGLALIILFV